MSSTPFVDSLKSCPYDPVHRVLASRYQMHIMRCKLSHPEIVLAQCPFNASHHMPKEFLAAHLMKCPDRKPLDKQMASSINQNNPFKGNTSVPAYNENVPESDEVWELDEKACAGYTPKPAPPDALIVDTGMMKPAERKKYYQNFQRNAAQNENRAAEPAPPAPSPRLPAAPKEREADREPNQSFRQYVNSTGAPRSGLGRGAQRGETRIAADIFRRVENGGGNPFGCDGDRQQTFQSVINGIENMNIGIGRGRGRQLQEAQEKEKYEEEFPSLGKSAKSNGKKKG